MNWFLMALKKGFTFKGRSRRREFGWFNLITFLISLSVEIIAAATDHLQLTVLSSTLSLIWLLVSVYLFICTLSLTTRRLHDLGWSGWWQLGFYLTPILMMLPFIGSLALLNSDGTLPLDARSGTMMAMVICYLLWGIVMLLVSCILLFKDGQPFTNQYGDSPKASQSPTAPTLTA